MHFAHSLWSTTSGWAPLRSVRKTATRRPARKPVEDTAARNSAQAPHEALTRLEARLAKVERLADRIADVVDEHLGR
jgi:hypothetical protein